MEVWRGGDDGLTLRFTDAVERALDASPAFSPGRGKQPRTLVVTIPTHLDWKEIGPRTRTFYEVVLTDHEGRHLGRMRGKCWDGQFDECAMRVCEYVEKVAARMP